MVRAREGSGWVRATKIERKETSMLARVMPFALVLGAALFAQTLVQKQGPCKPMALAA